MEVSIVEMNGAEGFAALLAGQTHLGLVADHGLVVDVGLQAEAVLTVALLAVLPAGHAMTEPGATEIGLEILAGETIFYRRPEHAPCYHQRVPELLQRARVTTRALRAVDGMGNVLAMVAAGYGVAILPDLFEAGKTPPPTLQTKRLRLPVSVPPLRLSVVWRPEGASAALGGFLEVARQPALTASS